MNRKSSPLTFGLSLLVLGCDPTVDLGDVPDGESLVENQGSCASPNTPSFAQGLAIPVDRYNELEAAALAEFGVAFPPPDVPAGSLVVVLSTDDQVACDAFTVDVGPDVTAQTLKLWLVPDVQNPGDYGLDAAHGGGQILVEMEGPNANGDPGGTKSGGTFTGELHIAAADADSIEGAVCFADDGDVDVDSLGFDPSTPFSVVVCPD